MWSLHEVWTPSGNLAYFSSRKEQAVKDCLYALSHSQAHYVCASEKSGARGNMGLQLEDSTSRGWVLFVSVQCRPFTCNEKTIFFMSLRGKLKDFTQSGRKSIDLPESFFVWQTWNVWNEKLFNQYDSGDHNVCRQSENELSWSEYWRRSWFLSIFVVTSRISIYVIGMMMSIVMSFVLAIILVSLNLDFRLCRQSKTLIVIAIIILVIFEFFSSTFSLLHLWKEEFFTCRWSRHGRDELQRKIPCLMSFSDSEM